MNKRLPFLIERLERWAFWGLIHSHKTGFLLGRRGGGRRGEGGGGRRRRRYSANFWVRYVTGTAWKPYSSQRHIPKQLLYESIPPGFLDLLGGPFKFKRSPTSILHWRAPAPFPRERNTDSWRTTKCLKCLSISINKAFSVQWILYRFHSILSNYKVVVAIYRLLFSSETCSFWFVYWCHVFKILLSDWLRSVMPYTNMSYYSMCSGQGASLLAWETSREHQHFNGGNDQRDCLWRLHLKGD